MKLALAYATKVKNPDSGKFEKQEKGHVVEIKDAADVLRLVRAGSCVPKCAESLKVCADKGIDAAKIAGIAAALAKTKAVGDEANKTTDDD